MTSPYELTHTAGTSVPYPLASNKKLTYTKVTFTGRATGTVTITVRPQFADRYVAPTSNTVNLATTNVWWLKECSLDGITIDDTANAGDDLGLVLEQSEEH